LPQRTMVAVLNFTSPSESFSDYVIEELIGELLQGRKVTVVDRRSIALIMGEMKFQYSGYVSDESIQSIGKMLGAQSIVSGSLTDMGTNYRFRIRIVSVETARIQTQISLDLKKDTQVEYLMGGKTAAREIERQEKSKPTSNVRDNWVSGELSGGYNLWQGTGLSVGARYERMFGPNVSLGVDFYRFIPFDKTYYESDYSGENHEIAGFDKGTIFGIDAFFRYYPGGKKFFLGLALGYHDGGNMVSDFSYDRWTNDPNPVKYVTAHAYGLAITGEFGWKIDVGNEGGFFVQPGFLGTFIVGKIDNHDASNWHDNNTSRSSHFNDELYSGYWRFYLGAGYAF
jgi:TolB-like protein